MSEEDKDLYYIGYTLRGTEDRKIANVRPRSFEDAQAICDEMNNSIFRDKWFHYSVPKTPPEDINE